MKDNTTNNACEGIPHIVKVYVGFYEAIPSFCFPGTTLDIGFMLFWMACFFAIRCVVVQIFYACGWPEGSVSTLDAAASFVGGYFHAPQVVSLSYALITSQKPYNPAAASKDDPKWWRDATDATLQICTAFMVFDFLFLVWTRYIPGQGVVLDLETILFMVHHFMTSFYMTTSRIYGAGQSSALTCMFLGEFTNTPFNTYFIFYVARRAGMSFSPFYAQFETPIELLTAVLFLLFRVVLSPIVLSYAAYCLLTDPKVGAYVPIAMRLLWTAMMAAVIFGSANQDIAFYNMIMEHMGYDVVAQEL